MALEQETNPPHHLQPYREVDDSKFNLPTDVPDVRGWKVLDPDGNLVGAINDLIVDTGQQRIRYLDIDLKDGFRGQVGDQHLLMPIGLMMADRENENVRVMPTGREVLQQAPLFEGTKMDEGYESALRKVIGPREPSDEVSGNEFYAIQEFDKDRYYGARDTNPRPIRE